jgi:hypothetical protein
MIRASVILSLILSLIFAPAQKLSGPVKIAGPVTIPAPSTSGNIPAFVQSVACVGSSTCAIAVTNSGDALYGILYNGGGAGLTLTFTDSQLNSWATTAPTGTGPNPPNNSLNVDGDTTAIGCAIAGSAGADTITAKIPSGPFIARMVFYEISGATCTVDASNSSNVVAGSPSSSGPITTTFSNDFIISSTGIDTLGNAFTVGAGWTNLKEADATHANNPLAGEIKVGTNSPGSFTGTMTYTAGSEYASIIVAYKHS